MVYTRKIYFSGGDFHELQAVFEVLPGVCDTRTGYINPAAGLAAAADVYAAVAAGTIPAVMGLEITYNPKKMDLSMLMDVLFAVVNPQLPDGQGKARGWMYRCGIWYVDEEDRPQLDFYLHFLANRGPASARLIAKRTGDEPRQAEAKARPCYARADRLVYFLPASEVHQHYLQKHPQQDTFIDWQRLQACLEF